MLRLLDVFSGAGGCARGYQLAGFHVTGVDLSPQPRYAGDAFIRGEALEYIREHGHEYDAIHASPPCQLYSMATALRRKNGAVYPDLLPSTREALVEVGRPWVIENVPGAPLRPDVVLCGCKFGLPIRRRRLFELSFPTSALVSPCHHTGPVFCVVGHGTPTATRKALGYNPTIHQWRAAMGIDWMTRDELSQAIPPAYTQFVGLQLIDHLAYLAKEPA